MNLRKTCVDQTFSVLLLFWAATAIVAPAQTFTKLLDLNCTSGCGSDSPLVQGVDGNFYGTTTFGGPAGSGSVFKMSAGGTLTTLHNFPHTQTPLASLVLGMDSAFYGTTVSSDPPPGTIFRINSNGAFTTLHSFATTDGSQPWSPLFLASDGSFYGATLSGGDNDEGALFKITAAAVLTTLHSFNSSDGSRPHGGLIQASDGNFYGVTEEGGTFDNGTIFRMTPTGAVTTLHSFNYNTDGSRPESALVQASSGNLYGTTSSGGLYAFGTVFRITLSGTFSTLYNFCAQSGCPDGGDPFGGLIQATDGNLYGTTVTGGSDGCVNPCGTIYRITPAGSLTTLHVFDQTGGASPYGGLMQATNGTFYGTTDLGGSGSNGGTVFSLSVGLGPFVRTVPIAGKVGTVVKILGGNLTGSTSVTFNGTAAAFTVVSKTLITATVPAGATTGKIQVVTPNRPLTSNVSFQVLP